MYEVDYDGLTSHVNNYFYRRIWSEELLYNAEHNLLVIAKTLVSPGFRNSGRYPKKNPAGFFLVNPPKKPRQKTHPKFNPVLFLVLLITKDFIMFKALKKL